MSSSGSVDLGHIHSLIDDYYKQKPSYTQHIPLTNSPPKENHPPKSTAEPPKSSSGEPRTKRTKEDVQRQFFYGLPPREKKQSVDMPVNPKEEETTGGSITDQVAKESSDSTASDHPLHDQSDQAAKAHKGAPGPVSVQDIGKPESKEELKKRAEELNQ